MDQTLYTYLLYVATLFVSTRGSRIPIISPCRVEPIEEVSITNFRKSQIPLKTDMVSRQLKLKSATRIAGNSAKF